METVGYRIFSRVSRSFVWRSLVTWSRQTSRVHFPKRIQFQFGQIKKYRSFVLGIPVSLIPVIMAASGEDNKEIIDKVEEMQNKKDFMPMYDLLIPHKDSKDAEILWRLARATTEKGKILGGEDRKTHIYEAFEYSKKALELDANNFACHKWYGILLDYTAEYEGNKKRISNAFLVKEHFMKAIELNPKDATTMYCLGLWCFLFADMPWLQRKIASALFASPPTSTYEEALDYFEKAEATDPGFYNQNVVMMGKTHLRLKHNEDAKRLLLKALEHEDQTADDKKARDDAKQLLKEMKVKF